MIKTTIPRKDSLSKENILEITKLINDVYNDAESGMWKSDILRTSTGEVSNLIENEKLIVAYLDNKVVGVVAVQSMPDGKTGEFAMLAADKGYRGQGIGSALITAAENWAKYQGFSRMRLELLTPKNWEQPSKTFLQKWYKRIGYIAEETEPFELMYPDKISQLATQCDFTIWHKTL